MFLGLTESPLALVSAPALCQHTVSLTLCSACTLFNLCKSAQMSEGVCVFLGSRRKGGAKMDGSVSLWIAFSRCRCLSWFSHLYPESSTPPWGCRRAQTIRGVMGMLLYCNNLSRLNFVFRTLRGMLPLRRGCREVARVRFGEGRGSSGRFVVMRTAPDRKAHLPGARQ